MALGSIFLLPNGTFIAELVIFLVVLGAMAKVVLPPLAAAREERERRIRAGLEAGDEGSAEAARLEQARLDRLEAARAAGRAVLEEAARTVERLVAEARAEGTAEHDRIVAAAAPLIEQARRAARDELAGRLDVLVAEAAQAVVGVSVDVARHRDVIDEVASRARAGSGV
ncbi:MAG TPA: hypothetical protein VKV23_05275 [Acidimicrobiales bacterium]|nr:hypothetical protein [Acidimicrobiales bacterium]